MSGTRPEELRRPFRRYRSRTPTITSLFWVIKVAVSMAGTLLGGLANDRLGLGITTMLTTTAAAVVILVQFAVARYVAGLYWLAVVVTSLFGVLIVGNLTDTFEVAPDVEVVVLTMLLIGAFIGWYLTEKTLSIHTVDTARRETFYWLVVLLTFALGTAVARLGSAALGLSYSMMALLCLVPAAVAWAGNRFAVLSYDLAFWLAYASTQPLGIAFADLLTQPRDSGGLNIDAAGVIGAVLAVILLAVAYNGTTHRDDPSLEYATRNIRI
jgi:uncharacterized membrane-anchored protein